MALFAIEVGVLVLNRAFVVSVTDFVFQHSVAVFYGMDKLVLLKQGKGAEYGASFCCLHPFFQFAQRERVVCVFQLFVDEQAHGRKLHAAMFQPLLYGVDVCWEGHRISI